MPVRAVTFCAHTARTHPAGQSASGHRARLCRRALNAGGFRYRAIRRVAMTGVLSSAADDLVLGKGAACDRGHPSLCAFLVGAMTHCADGEFRAAQSADSAVTYTRAAAAGSSVAAAVRPGGRNAQSCTVRRVSLTAILLCCVMGLQNALVTKISSAEIRTTRHRAGHRFRP